jgi:small conductance mechanosensitive channel
MPDWKSYMPNWLTEEWLMSASLVGIQVVVTLIIGFILRVIATKVIDRVIRTMVTNRAHERPRAVQVLTRATVLSDPRREQRIGALGSLARSTVTVFLAIIVGLTVLSELHFNIATLLAGTSIIGIAVAFGVQSILRDVISGIFMLLEDQIGLGDYVKIADVDGVVEDVGLRLTQIRDASGTVWYMRNGDIAKVANYSQGNGTGRPPEPEAVEPAGETTPLTPPQAAS